MGISLVGLPSRKNRLADSKSRAADSHRKLPVPAAAWVALCGLLPAVAGAVPFAWIPGSSQDLPRTGNQMVIVDLGARQVLGTFTVPEVTTGVDPLPTQFSPDGKYAYVIAGGFDPDDPGDPEQEDRTSRIFVYDVADVLAKIQSNPGDIHPLYPATIVPPHSGNSLDSANTDEPFPTLSPNGSHLYIVSQDEKKLVTYAVNSDGSLTQLGMLDTGQQPIRLDLNIAADRGYVVNFKDKTVSVYNLSDNPPTLVTTVAVPQNPNNSNPISSLVFQGAVGAFPYPSGNTLLAAVPPTNDNPYLVFSGGWGPVIPNPFPPFTPFNYDYALYAIDTQTNTPTKLYTYRTTGRTDEVTLPLLIGFETVAPAPLLAGRSLAALRETLFNLGGTQHITGVTGSSATRRTIPRPSGYIYTIPFLPKDERILHLSSASDINFATLQPTTNQSKLYKVDIDANPLQATDIATLDRTTCGFFGQDDADTLWVAGNDIYSFAGFSGFDVVTADPRNSKIYYVTTGTGTVEASLTLPLAGGAISVLSKEPPPVTPTPTPTGTPPPLVDSDGDGYSDAYETAQGFDPNDPADHPTLGDVNGDSDVTFEDALLLYRWKTGAIDGSGFIGPDLNGDHVSDVQDALILYFWLLRETGSEIIPTAF